MNFPPPELEQRVDHTKARQTDLHLAVMAHNVHQMEEAIAKEPESVNMPNGSGQTPLSVAVAGGVLLVVELRRR